MLSLVIPTHNKWPRLRLTLISLEAVQGEIPFEVVIVNDGSTDETAKGLADYAAPYPLQVVQHEQPLGRSGARNAGAAVSTGDRILFLDDDCLVVPTITDAHGALPDDVVGHGRIYNMPYLKFFLDPAQGTLFPDLPPRRRSSLAEQCVTEEMIRSSFDRIVAENRKVNALERLTDSVLASAAHRDLAWVACAGANLSLPRSLMEQHPFDVSFGLNWGAEDLDLGIRLLRSGHEIRQVEGAAVYHMDHLRSDFDEQVRRSFAELADRHPEREHIALVRQFLLREITLEELLRQSEQ